MDRSKEFNEEQDIRKQQNKTYLWVAFVVTCILASFFISTKFLWGLLLIPLLWIFNIDWKKENEKINKEVKNIPE